MRMDNDSVEKWQHTDEGIQKNLPLGMKLIYTLQGHKWNISLIKWSPDGRILTSSTGTGIIQQWDTETGKYLDARRLPGSGLHSFAFNQTGDMLVSTNDNAVKLWKMPSGELIHTLEGHTGIVLNAAFNQKGDMLASTSSDNTIKLWEVTSGKLIHTLEGHTGIVLNAAFNQKGDKLASISADKTVKLWEVASGKLIYTLEGESGDNYIVAFNPTGDTLVSVSDYKNIKLWEVTSGKLINTLEGKIGHNTNLIFDQQGNFLIILDGTVIKLYDASTGKLLKILEGHTGEVTSGVFSPCHSLFASRSMHRREIFLWRTDTFECVAKINFGVANTDWASLSIAFHPYLPYLAGVIWDTTDPDGEPSIIHVYELDLDVLLSQVAGPSAHYLNAKVVMVGDTGVGKTGLSLVLNNQPFEATDSTPGRRVWTFDSQEVNVGSNTMQTRETLLWDLAGQPGYRIIHQLHLNEVAVALVVFDARSEIDPWAGVRHWERALRLAKQRQGILSVPMRKFLVSARNDRGGVSISEERLRTFLNEFDFDGYFKTSAKEGWQIKELREAIKQAIIWEDLPEVSSSQLFADIKSFLLDVKKTGRLLALVSELYDNFVCQHSDTAKKVTNLQDQFDTCIGRLENRDLIRQLSFGGYILLQPELLDAYASAMVNKAKDEPDGLGSIAEEVVLAGKFFVPEEQKVQDPGQEQLLLHATVEELICHDLALWENANDGHYLVFPSQFNRDYEDAPEPKGSEVSITFDGPVQSLYSTLAVRLNHSELFVIGREEMWRNAAVFTAEAGGKCGLYLHEFDEARGRLTLFFDEQASQETRFHFEKFVLTHTERRALDGTVELLRFFVCPECGDPVPDYYVKRLRNKGITTFSCPCGGTVSLADPKERIHFRSEVESMDKSADHHRDFDAFVMSAKGETSTKSFQNWAGGDRVTLAIVFTDVVGSMALGEEIRDEAMNDVRRAHFTQSRRLIDKFKGREIKTIGDSFMAAFKSVDSALDYAREFHRNTGHLQVEIRAGIHIGPMQIEEGDVFGGTVNFAARVIGAIKDAEIWLSDQAKEDIDRLGASKHNTLEWKRHDGVAMKGFPGVFTLWSVSKADLIIGFSKRETEKLEVNHLAADKHSQYELVLSRLKSYVIDKGITSPRCFISYAWGIPDHESWVEQKLATDLQKAGLTVVLDRWENIRIGASVPRFVELVGKTDRVIVVGTPLYQKKYENNEPMGGFVVAAEGDLIGKRMIGAEAKKESVLPVLLEGTEESSFPLLLQGRVYADFSKNGAYFDEMFKLLLSLYQIPLQHKVAVELRELLMGQKEL